MPLFDRTPEADAKLWKYLSFAKFVLLLNCKAVHCTRIDRFEDRIEGRWPLADLDRFRSSRDSLKGLADARRNAVVTSWVERENESAAMWPVYGGTPESVAIVTTFAELKRAVEEKAKQGRNEEWHVGNVRYLDFGADEGVFASEGKPPVHKVFTLKHSSYEHEHEVRALGIRVREHMPEDGAEIPIALERFIKAVVVNPRASAWFADLVAEAAAAHGLEGRVKRSEITDLEESSEKASGE